MTTRFDVFDANDVEIAHGCSVQVVAELTALPVAMIERHVPVVGSLGVSNFILPRGCDVYEIRRSTSA
jgi:hypothetical protein